jgi:adenine-specific DNA-methyltransferase
MTPIDSLEVERVELQLNLDERKTQAERNRLGQFATPTDLASNLLSYASGLKKAESEVRFLDPAFGTGAFYSALLRIFPKRRIAQAVGFEIDPHYGAPAAGFWSQHGLTFRLEDFTRAEPTGAFNLLICNPPYVRHHHLEAADKSRLQRSTFAASGMKLSGLAGLYCHFLGISHAWMAKDGIGGWLIPSEFMDVNYGREIKKYLLDRVTLLHIHRFDPNDVQFADALVSSAVVWIRNSPPPANHEVVFSFGGTLDAPRIVRKVSAATLVNEPKWTRFPVAEVREASTAPTISDFFRIKRGLATGDNTYFILPAAEIENRGLPPALFKPILPSPRYLADDIVQADECGNPKVEKRLFLLDTMLSEAELEVSYPTLWKYLEEGKSRGLHERYLCSHRSVWYAQENRPPAPIVCTYLGRRDTKRGRPFRFILNESTATAANVYLMMYPTPALTAAIGRDPGLIRRIWTVLNELTPQELLSEGRVYGGGLHKLEPKELGNVQVPQLLDIMDKGERPMKQEDLFSRRAA